MTTSSLSRCALGALAAAMLAGCSNVVSGSTGAGLPAAFQKSAVIGHYHAPLSPNVIAKITSAHIVPKQHLNQGKSWMLPDAKKQWLLYVSDTDTGTIDVYNERVKKGKLYGQLTGFNQPRGICVDSQSNVYVTDAGTQYVVEFSHSGEYLASVTDS